MPQEVINNEIFEHFRSQQKEIDNAKKLLKEDGLIFVHCDFNEDSYLKVLMDELFEEN